MPHGCSASIFNNTGAPRSDPACSGSDSHSGVVDGERHDPPYPGSPPPNCGDGNVDDDEECDDGANNGPEALCYANCTLNVCGDAVQSPAEQCDLGADNGPDNGCSSECVLLPSACGNQAVMAELTPLPVDIIIVIDNSGSMSAEIQGVQDNINVNFAAILDNSGIDYRVILVSNHGDVDGQSVCIEAPLSGIPHGRLQQPAQPSPSTTPASSTTTPLDLEHQLVV
jgi:hypothetical protein